MNAILFIGFRRMRFWDKPENWPACDMRNMDLISAVNTYRKCVERKLEIEGNLDKDWPECKEELERVGKTAVPGICGDAAKQEEMLRKYMVWIV